MTIRNTRTGRGVGAVLIAAIVLIAMTVPAAAVYDPSQGDVDPDPNNPFPQVCGANVMLVLDNSASLSEDTAQTTGNLTHVKSAANQTVDVLSQTDAISGVGVVQFNGDINRDDANTVIGITELQGTSDVESIQDAIGTIQHPEQETQTNWEAGLLEASMSENDQDGDVPNEDLNKPADLVILISDGRPNARGYNDTQTQLGDAVNAAADAANVVKSEGARIIGVGFPGSNGNIPAAAPFEAITNGTSSTTDNADDQLNDYYITNSSANLDSILTDIVSEFSCDIDVEKLNDANDDDTYTDDETAPFPGDDVTYQVTVTNTGNIDLSLEDYVDDKYGTPTLTPTLVGETLQPGESTVVTFVGEAPPENGVKQNTFTVTASDGNGYQIDVSDNTTVRSPDLTPSISVEKLVDANDDGTYADSETAANVSGDVTYQVTVTNDGPNDVTLDDWMDDTYPNADLNQSLTDVTLAPDESITVTFNGTAPVDEEATKTNTFTVNATDDDGDSATDSDTANVTAPDLTPSIDVQKVVDADGDGTYAGTEQADTLGATVTYKVTVTNDGPNTVTLANWTDDIYPGASLNASLDGTVLKPGESATFTFDGTAPQEELGTKTNTFTVNATDDDGDVATDDDTATVEGADLTPAISVEKLVDGDDDGTFADEETANSLSGSVTYQVNVTNTGPNAVTVDGWTDDMYPNASLDQSLVGVPLQPGESVLVTFEGTAPDQEEATKTNTFAVDASDADGDTASDSDTATIVAPDLTPSITVEKVNDANADGTFSDDETTAMPNDDVIYMVTVTNDGPNSVTIANWSDSVYSPTLNQSLNGVSLAAGESITVTFNGSSPTAEDTAKTNVFSVNATDDDGDVATAEDDTTVRSPDLTPEISVEKLVDGNDDGVFANQETANNLSGAVTYKVNITNIGPNTVTIDSWMDDTYPSASLNQTLDGVTLAPGESIFVTFEGTAPAEEEATKTNTFTVNASDDDGDETSDSDDATVVAPDLTPSITVEKVNDANADGTFSDDETTAMPGDNLTYKIVVTNDGPNTVEIDTYTDDVYGTPTLNQSLTGVMLASGESITVTFEGSSPTAEDTAKTNVFNVTASDGDGDIATAEDDTTVRSPDLTPEISVEKLVDGDDDGAFADQETANEVGGNATYKVIVTNVGNNTVDIDSWTDNMYPGATLNQSLVGVTLTPGESITVTFEGNAPAEEEATKTNTFTVDASDDDGDVATDDDTATIVAPDLTPSITVEKVNDGNADGTFSDDETTDMPGDAVTYKVVVTNDGPNTVEIDSWTDDTYSGVDLNQSLVGVELASGESIAVTFNGSSPSAEDTVKTNVFNVTASDGDGDVTSAEDDTTVRSPDLTPGISVVKSVDANGDEAFSDAEIASSVGGDVTYKVTVTNTGQNDVTIDSYTDDVYGSPSLNQSLNGETLAPGESITVTFNGTAPADEEATKTNTFTVTASDNDGDEASDSDTASVTAPDLDPSIIVEKLVDGDDDGSFADQETASALGGTVTYKVIVTNDGPNNVTIDDWMDDTYPSADLNASLIGESLAPGESITVTFNGTAPVDEEATKTNTFTVNASDDDGDPASDADTATVVAPDLTPSITVVKVNDGNADGTFSDDETTAMPGDTVTYMVTVTNDGPNDVTINSWMDDTYPSAQLNQTLNGETLAPGESITVTFNGSSPSAEDTVKTNVFNVTASDDDGDIARAEDDTTVRSPDLTPEISVVKNVDANGDGTFADSETASDVGGEVVYQVVVTNDGLNNVTIDSWTDNLYPSAQLNQTLNGETLAPGESVTVTFNGTAPVDEEATKTNTFTVNASDNDGDSASDSDTASVTAPDLDPSIIVEKLVDGDDDGTFADQETAADVGGDVTYKVVVRNDGPNTITIDSWSDDTYPGASLNQSLDGVTLQPGESVTVTFEGNASEIEEATKTNTFTVNASDADGDETSDSDTATVVTPDLTPSISVDKVNDANADGSFTDDETTAMPDDPVTYQVTITNDGPNTVTIANWSDSVYDSPGLNQSLNGVTLASGESITVTFEGNSSTAEDTAKTNVFSVNATDGDGDVASAEDDTTVRSPDLVPSISVTKSVDANGDGIFSESEEAGDVDAMVVYKVVVSNDGPNDVTIDSWNDDTYASPTLNQSLVGVTLAPGESITVTFNGTAPSDYDATKTNTFTVTASDGDGDVAQDSDTATVTSPPAIHVCPRTPGFWKTHNGDYATGNNLDLTGELLPITLGDGPESVTVDSDDVANAIFSASLTADSKQSNGISKLYIHLLAAKLNVENGAHVPSEVADAIERSDEILGQYDESGWKDIKKNDKDLAAEILDLKDTLDAFNNGYWADEDCVQDWWKDNSTAAITVDGAFLGAVPA